MHKSTGSQDYNSPSDHKFLSSWCLQHQLVTEPRHCLKYIRSYNTSCTARCPVFVVSTFHHFIALFPAHADRTYCHSSTWETAQFKTWSCPTEDLNEAIMAILRLCPQKFHYSNSRDYCQWVFTLAIIVIGNTTLSLATGTTLLCTMISIVGVATSFRTPGANIRHGRTSQTSR